MTAPATSPRHVLIARLDNAGDMLLAGPAVRAAAATAQRVTVLCGERGAPAARLLPGVDAVTVWSCPWIVSPAPPVDRDDVAALVCRLHVLDVDTALILTSFHQSPLPLALLLRLAGVGRIGGSSEDHPGTLLDVRHSVWPERHEVVRSLELAADMGLPLPAGDDGRLQVRPGEPPPGCPAPPYVAVHPGASMAARTVSPSAWAAHLEALRAAGWQVVVTGGPSERRLTAAVSGPPRAGVTDLGGATDLAGLAAVLAGADAVVCGNTGLAHLAAAVGTPVVSLFAPTVPWQRWRPWMVPSVCLGEQEIACAGCRAITCPVAGHPCIEDVGSSAVVAAVAGLAVAELGRVTA